MTGIDPIGDAQLVTAGTLTGKTLFDHAGDKLGVIKEIFIDRVTGQVEFVLGSTGGFMGVGEKFHPLPWSVLSYNLAPEGYVAHVDREALKHAPAYDREQLGSAHYGWSDQVRRYFANLHRPVV
jgi:hypothetical protein